jgi:transposase InsO family protein
VKYRFIQQHRQRWPVEWMCHAFGVARSGFYAWQRRPPARRTAADAELTAQLRLLHRQYRGHYGSPRLRAVLCDTGIRCSRKRIARLLRNAGLTALLRKRRRRTTQVDPRATPAANLLDRRFTPGDTAAMAADVTYLRTAEGWLYLAVILSVQTRRILGYSLGLQVDCQLCLAALSMALARFAPAPGTLHHSDRGSTYTAEAYQARLVEAGLMCSMSGVGNCYDNAVAESFFNTLKREGLRRQTPATRAAATALVVEFIRNYNSHRKHSALDNLSPERYAALHPALI